LCARTFNALRICWEWLICVPVVQPGAVLLLLLDQRSSTMQTPGTLLLIDGTSILYRAFFAIRELSTRSGRPTNAVFGFIRMLKQARDAWHATHWIVVFDGGLPQHRMELVPEYKAQRPPMPAALRAQVGTAVEYLERAGIAWLRQDGQEADDVLASLCAQAESASEARDILVVTSDKDMYQLVGGKVRIAPVAGKGGLIGTEEVRVKTGVEPGQIVDWLALTGDASDNIAGVPGIGPKTAADLIRRYGNLEGLWAGVDELPEGKVKVALVQHRDLVQRNVAMVRLNRTLACVLDWDTARVHPVDPARLLPLLEELEFTSMVHELQERDLFAP
jgi:DNA polymerase I